MILYCSFVRTGDTCLIGDQRTDAQILQPYVSVFFLLRGSLPSP